MLTAQTEIDRWYPANAAPHELLRCPTCDGALRWTDSAECVSCHVVYPVVDGIPILICDERSAFCRERFVERRETFFKPPSRRRLLIDAVTPSIALGVTSRRNYQRVVELLLQRGRTERRVLVIGAAYRGAASGLLLDRDDVDVIETDVSFGPQTRVICDGHDLPFADGTFDAVVSQAVLEHVLDPVRCVAEMHRVLRTDGLVYAEVAFMQPVHGGAFDFTRFTHSGLSNLFRSYERIDSGTVCGPGSALAYAFTYFLQAFARPGISRKLVARVGRYLAFPLKHFDRALARRETALDGASSLFFLGLRSERTKSPKDIVAEYRGGQ